MHPETERRPRGEGFVRGASSALAFWLIPALLGVLAVRGLFPPVNDAFEPAAEGSLALFADHHASLLWAGFFLFFAVVARYWESQLGILKLGEKPEASAPGNKAFAGIGSVVVVGVAAAAALFLRESVMQPYRVLGASMLPGIGAGSYLAVNKTAYGLKLPGRARSGPRAPKRGEVVVFQAPEKPGAATDVVKRVIGLPGDRIRMKGNMPVINDWLVPTCFIGQYPLLGTPGGPTVVRAFVEFLGDASYLVAIPGVQVEEEPPGDYYVQRNQVFVVGDNRSMSVDSRTWARGRRPQGLAQSSIVGRVDRVLLDADRNGNLDVRHPLGRIGMNLHLSGIDSHVLESNIALCMTRRPKDANPPRSDWRAVR